MSRSTRTPTPAPAHETYLESLLQELRTREGGQENLFGASIGSALEAIWANRTRSLLTMLGIVIGITAVIGALTLTKGVGIIFGLYPAIRASRLDPIAALRRAR